MCTSGARHSFNSLNNTLHLVGDLCAREVCPRDLTLLFSPRQVCVVPTVRGFVTASGPGSRGRPSRVSAAAKVSRAAGKPWFGVRSVIDIIDPDVTLLGVL